MLKYLAIVLVLTTTIRCQDPATGDLDFAGIMAGVIGQWGEVTPETWAEMFNNFTQGGNLNSIWHGIDEHCSSNIQCGEDACCLKPNLHGKRAITDGSHVHFGSYCAKLRKSGETCSIHDNNKQYYNFHCPCVNTVKCVPGAVVSLHPLIQIPTQAVCK